MSDNTKLSPERAVRLLRAKAGELENIVRVHTDVADQTGQDIDITIQLAADIALVATLLADLTEDVIQR